MCIHLDIRTVRWSTATRSGREAITVLELLVTVSIVAILAGLLLPAIGAARESARRVQCTSHLREVGIALHHHHDVKQAMPVGWTYDASARSAYGWAVPLLPYLEQPALFARIDRTKFLSEPAYHDIRATSLEIMLCPSDITQPQFTLYADGGEGDGDDEADEDNDSVAKRSEPGPRRFPLLTTHALVQLPTANYVGVFGAIESDDSIPAPVGDGAFLENKVVRFRDFSRGLCSTLVVGERTMAQVPSTWLGVELAGEDAAARLVGSALEGINNPLADECDFSSRHPGGAHFLWGDAHVSFVTQDVDLDLYHEWSRLRQKP